MFPTLSKVRWWQSWLSHVGTGYEGRWDGGEDYREEQGNLWAYCTTCEEQVMAMGVSNVRLRDKVVSRLVPWVNERGRTMVSQMSTTEQEEVGRRSEWVEARMVRWIQLA